jgi:hypothetical protein
MPITGKLPYHKASRSIVVYGPQTTDYITLKQYKDTHKEKDLTDPKYIGPGLWYTIHTSAKISGEKGDYASKKEFVDLMDSLRNNFKCMTCRKHIGEYLDTHAFDPYWKLIDPKSGKDVGLFKWSFDFHNAVNQRLGYPIMDWLTAYSLYYDESNICDLNCGH